MRRHRRAASRAGTLALAMALLAAGCGNQADDEGGASGGEPKGTVTVGSFDFSESAILAEIYGGALRAGGYQVPVKRNLGKREVVAPALERGDIDLYPGYAATDLEFLRPGQASSDVQATVQKLRDLLAPKNLTALEPSTAVDTNAFAVTRPTADRYKLRRLSDLAPVAKDLVLGGPPECPSRPFCQQGLERVYGLKFKAFKPLDVGGPLTKAALDRGDVDVALILSTDGAIAAKGYAVLEDDRHLQNADNVVPIIRNQAATPEVRDILNRVSANLTTEDLIRLNKRADLDKEDPDVLGDEWLQEHGFTR